MIERNKSYILSSISNPSLSSLFEHLSAALLGHFHTSRPRRPSIKPYHSSHQLPIIIPTISSLSEIRNRRECFQRSVAREQRESRLAFRAWCREGSVGKVSPDGFCGAEGGLG